MSRNFKIYKSSAGSGKTTALIRIFLSISLASPNANEFKSILAITFTNKAANELKERFVENLRAIAAIDPSGNEIDYMVKGILEDTSLTLPELKKRAERVFDLALRDYGDIAIGTIDGFNHKLIRSFSRDLHLNSDFEVEINESELFSDAVEALLQRVGESDRITGHLVNFIHQSIDDDRRANIDRKLKDLQHLVIGEESRKGVEAIREIEPLVFDQLRASFFNLIKSFEKNLKAKGAEAIKLVQEKGLTADDFHGKSRGMYSFFKKVSTFSGKRVTLSGTQQKNFDSSWAHPKISAEGAAVFPEVEEHLRRIYREIEDLQEKDFSAYKLAKKLIAQIDLLAVLADLSTERDNLIQERNILPISDFNRVISESLRNEPVAFIYEKYGNRYKYVLIDEFQDTSELQWKNLTPMISESLARGFLSMVVGDAKQSIYRWRGGKAEQLIRLPELDPADEAIPVEMRSALSQNAEVIPLDTNFRSLENIIRFNNAFVAELTPLLTRDERLFRGEYTGESALQKIPPERPGGFIEIARITEDDREAATVTQTVKFVKEALNDGYSYGDIAILVRKRGDLVNGIIEVLHEEKIPLTTKDSFGLDQDLIVNMLVSFLRITVNPDSNAEKVKIIRALTELHDLPFAIEKYIDGKPYQKAVKLDRFLAENFDHFALEDMQYSGAWTLTSAVVAHLIPEKQRGSIFIESFLNCILENGGRSLSPSSFIDWWDKQGQKPEVKTEGEGDKLQVMTIHKSKGLQFPVVILPELSWMKDNGKTEKWVPAKEELKTPLQYYPLIFRKELREMGYENEFEFHQEEVDFDNLNLIYVAMTRPSERLCISFSRVDQRYTGHSVASALSSLVERLKADSDFVLEVENDSESELPLRIKIGEKIKFGISENTLSGEKTIPSPPPCYKPLEARFRITSESLSDPRTAGTLFHRLAEETDSMDEATKWVETKRITGLINRRVSEELLAMANTLFSDERYQSLQEDYEVFRERAISAADGIYRPDAVFKNDDEFVVVDFKTGNPSDQHFKQMKNYLEAIKSAWDLNGRGFVFYIGEGKWEEVKAQTSGQTSLF